MEFKTSTALQENVTANWNELARMGFLKYVTAHRTIVRKKRRGALL